MSRWTIRVIQYACLAGLFLIGSCSRDRNRASAELDDERESLEELEEEPAMEITAPASPPRDTAATGQLHGGQFGNPGSVLQNGDTASLMEQLDGEDEFGEGTVASNLPPPAVGFAIGESGGHGLAQRARRRERMAKAATDAPKRLGEEVMAPAPEPFAQPEDDNDVTSVDSLQGSFNGRKDAPEGVPQGGLPRTFYFENTYLGGNAAYLEQLRRLDEELGGEGRPHRLARSEWQPFDAPPDAGLGLNAALSTRWLDQPGKVYLQVGLRGSERYGWRRPPLELVLVLDSGVWEGEAGTVERLIRALFRTLGPQDSLGIVLAGDTPEEVAALSRLRALRTDLLPRIHTISVPEPTAPGALSAAMRHAGGMLQRASEHRTTLPGTQIALVVTRGRDAQRVSASRAQAHHLTVQGVVTSVIQLGSDLEGGDWWSVANAGHGNYHRCQGADGLVSAIRSEVQSLARVVARLLRLNIRLAPGVKAIRVLGSHVLDAETVQAVREREVATDRNLSRAHGIESDRGEDDDGIQTVIPYFYGGDSHVVIVELWVDRPGPIADVTVRYKDMVGLSNATARTAVSLRNVPRPPTEVEKAVTRSLDGFHVAGALHAAAGFLERSDGHAAVMALRRVKTPLTTASDDALVMRFENLLLDHRWRGDPAWRSSLTDALRLAGRRKVGGADGS